REREIDLLRYQVDEIRSVDPRPGETDALRSEEARLAHGERLVELAGQAEAAIGADGAAAEHLASAAHELDAAPELDPATATLQARAGALAAEAVELARDLRAYRESLVLDTGRAEAVRARISDLKGLQRKYGAGDDEVLGFLRTATERLETLS